MGTETNNGIPAGQGKDQVKTETKLPEKPDCKDVVLENETAINVDLDEEAKKKLEKEDPNYLKNRELFKKIGEIKSEKLLSEHVELGLNKLRSSSIVIEKTFEDWVKRNVNVRECIKFVKKKDNKDNPICKCGNKRNDHIPRTVEQPPDSKWDQKSCTTLIENNSFGKINFSGVDTNTQPQYMRVAVDNGHSNTIKKMERLFTEFWKLNEPDLLISVTGGAKSFNVSHDICVSFQQGLLSAAKSTNAWLITGGQNCGVMKLVGDVIGRSIFTSKICTIGVGNWGKTWRREMLLNRNRIPIETDEESLLHPQSREPIVNYTLDAPAKGYAALDPNHTHHFLVDDGTAEKEGIEIEFRGELENLICNMFTKDGVSLPMVCIMIEGGMQSIDQAVSTLRKGNTLVVLKGSGRASDILCYGFEHSIEVETVEDGEKKKVRMLTEPCRKEMIKLIDKDFSKYRAQGIVEKMITAVLEISMYRETVTVFSIYNPEPLDFYILSSLMQSSGNSATRMRQMRLAITWGHARVAKEFIFSRKEYKFSSDELNSLLLFSIIKQRTAFVKLLIDYGADVRAFVTQTHLTRLYNELRSSTGGYRLLQEKRKKEKIERGKNTKSEGGLQNGRKNKNRFSIRRKDKGLRGVMLSDVGSIMGTVMQGSYKSIFCDPKYNERAQGDETFENPFDILTMYSALADCQPMALLFWENCKTPMATGLVAHKIYMFLDKMEGKWARMDEEMTEKLENAAHEFEMLSCSLLTACYHNYDKSEWINILTVKMKDWGHLSLFDIANITNCKNFISHAAYQSHLTDIWMGNIHASTPTWKLLLSIIPPLPIFLSFNNRVTNKDGTMKRLDMICEETPHKFSSRERLELYYTSPVIKFFLNTITYLIFLMLFMTRLIATKSASSSKSSMGADYYTLVFVISTLPVEVSQIMKKHTKSVKKRVLNHFKRVYNISDFLAVLLFLVAFCIKARIDSDDDGIYDLNKFSSYHQYRLIASLCFGFYSLRFVQMFEINSQIGPKLFMLKRMSIDLFFFLFLLLVFTVTYSIASEALLYPFNNNTLGDSIFMSVKRSYLNVFGDIGSEDMDKKLVTGHCNVDVVNQTFWQSMSLADINKTEFKKTIEHTKKLFKIDIRENLDLTKYCSDNDIVNINVIKASTVGKVNYYITFFLLCCYLLFVNIMLINLLIAIFSNTYAESEAKSGIIYKTQRSEVILEFKARPWLPNPLSLVYFIILFFQYVVDKCFCKKKLYRSQIKKVNRQNASFNAFRASLIESECVAIYMRRKKAMAASTNVILEQMQLKMKNMTNGIERIETHLKKTIAPAKPKMEKQESGETVEDKTEVEGAVTVTKKEEPPQHKLSRINPYAGAEGILRYTVPDEKVPWSVVFEWYDPNDFTDETVTTDETDNVEDLKFNAIDGKVDRISLYKPYEVVDGDPLNPCGRTGLKGRGSLLRWGPNKFAVTIVTRWARPGTGNAFSIKNKQVIEILLVKQDKSQIFSLPKIQMDKESDKRVEVHRRVMKKVCYDYENVSAAENDNVDKLLQKAFQTNCMDVYSGYFDDSVNTDNAWVEVDVVTVHVDGQLATTPPAKGSTVLEATWMMLNKKPVVRQNDAWLLKRVCTKLRCYNPWRGEVLL